MDCPHSTPEPWQECRNPNRPILAAEAAWKGRRFAGNPGTGRTGGCAAGASGVFASFGRSFLTLWATRHATATTKYFYMYVFIAVVVVCCGEVGMRGETAWTLGAGLVRDFQIRTVGMWECWRTGRLGNGGGPNLQRRPQAGTRYAQCRFSGWVEIWALSASGAAIALVGFARLEDWFPGLQ